MADSLGCCVGAHVWCTPPPPPTVKSAANGPFRPGGFSGWHSHPGTAVLVIDSGELTVFSEPVGGGKCSIHTFTAGQVFLEQPNDEENTVAGTAGAHVGVTFFNVPHGGPTRIERTDPGDCQVDRRRDISATSSALQAGRRALSWLCPTGPGALICVLNPERAELGRLDA